MRLSLRLKSNASDGNSILPMLLGFVLLGAVVMSFTSNNNERLVAARVAKLLAPFGESTPRALALADAAAALPPHYASGQVKDMPRLPSQILVRGAMDAFDRAQILRVFLRIGGLRATAVNWCPADGTGCRDLVATHVAGKPMLLDPVHGGALRKDATTFLRRNDLPENEVSAWPNNAPRGFTWLQASGLFDAWPALLDQPDQMMAYAFWLAFLIGLILVRRRARKAPDDPYSQGKEGTHARIQQARLRALEMKAEDCERNDDELARAAEEADAFLAEIQTQEAMGEVVGTAPKRRAAEAQTGEHQLADLDERDRQAGDRYDERGETARVGVLAHQREHPEDPADEQRAGVPEVLPSGRGVDPQEAEASPGEGGGEQRHPGVAHAHPEGDEPEG